MGPAVPVDPEAPPIDRFAGFLGRTARGLGDLPWREPDVT
jgi:hypothetical protein